MSPPGHGRCRVASSISRSSCANIGISFTRVSTCWIRCSIGCGIMRQTCIVIYCFIASINSFIFSNVSCCVNIRINNRTHCIITRIVQTAKKSWTLFAVSVITLLIALHRLMQSGTAANVAHLCDAHWNVCLAHVKKTTSDETSSGGANTNRNCHGSTRK